MTVGQPQAFSLLLVDDDVIIAESLQYILSDEYTVNIATDRKHCIDMLEKYGAPELALVDLGLPPDTHKPDEGFAVIEYIKENYPSTIVIVLSGQDNSKYVDAAKKLGAVDFIPKPCDIAELKVRLKKQLSTTNENIDGSHFVKGIVGKSEPVELLRMQIKQLTDSPFPILIQGESGSGKELTAQNLHECSNLRKNKPFLTLNCAAFNGDLLESQLFGHAKGSFTGATDAKKGFFEEAGNGTLFLDEIADLPIDLQAKLLRVLENGEFYRIGETQPRKSLARVLSASNKNLFEAIARGLFREDLFHRLSVLTINVPSVRERADDKLLLLDYFQEQIGQQLQGFTLNESARQAWEAYSFPGNVRELRNIVIRLSAKYPGQTIKREILENEMISITHVADSSAGLSENDLYKEKLESDGFQLNDELKRIELVYIDIALKESGNNMSKAAELLGVNRSTLYGRVER